MTGEIKNHLGERIDYSWHPGRPGNDWVSVLGHGVTGNKDRPFLVALAQALADHGTSVLRLSFSGNGASAGQFADSTITKEAADLGAVLDGLAGHRLIYIGHSMGGAVGVVRASQDRRIEGLVSLAGMVHTADFAQREFGGVKPGAGFMWDNPACPLSQAYINDMTQIGNVLDRAPRIQVPWLLVHGIEDDVVPIAESREIAQRATAPKLLVELPGVNHVFEGDGCAQMTQAVIEWFKTRGW